METFQTFDTALLNGAGLNRHAVFNIDDLPADIAASLASFSEFMRPGRQLILIGHAGRQLWEAVKATKVDSEHPIDDFTIGTVKHWFAQCQPESAYEILYPGPALIPLQRLGQLAGWHHATPFMVGIDPKWGTWYAYRAAVVADTRFEPTRPVESEHACTSCHHKLCIASCPAAALDGGHFDFAKCIGYRKQSGSHCRDTCVARISCPVGSEHRYDEEQIHHSYSLSLQAIEKYY